MDYIERVVGREILNARGKPTVEAELISKNGIRVVASVPSGTSAGKYEAYELYDGQKRYGGYGTRKAAANISEEISDRLQGIELTNQKAIDSILCELDGTDNKSRLGANAILAVSVAAAKAGAQEKQIPVYRYLAGQKYGVGSQLELPDIVATVIAGGVFSDSGLEFEDYMAIFHGFSSFRDELEALVSLRLTLERRLKEKYGVFPEDGGALAPPLENTEEAFRWILETANELGYKQHVSLGLDVAASELWNDAEQAYLLKRRKDGKSLEEKVSSKKLAEYYQNLCKRYPLKFIEDGFEQDAFQSFAELRSALPGVQIVGDDLFVSNVKRLRKGIACHAANGLLLKINQIGTVTEAMEAAALAEKNGYDVIVSLRSGETTDDFIADLAVAVGAKQIKLGSPVRAERNVKYNRLLRIEEELREEK